MTQPSNRPAVTTTYPQYSVAGRTFTVYAEAQLFARQWALTRGPVDLMKKLDAWSAWYRLERVEEY